MVRSIAQWVDMIGTANATHRGDAEAAADTILTNIAGYCYGSKHRKSDINEIANAIQAYAKLLQDAGVTIVTD